MFLFSSEIPLLTVLYIQRKTLRWEQTSKFLFAKVVFLAPKRLKPNIGFHAILLFFGNVWRLPLRYPNGTKEPWLSMEIVYEGRLPKIFLCLWTLWSFFVQRQICASNQNKVEIELLSHILIKTELWNF